jgi:hypothetical protein
MPEFKKVIAKLKKHYGSAAVPPAKGSFELVMWENACYLLPDDRRAAVFEGLRKQAGLNARAILKASPDVLLQLATMGGMRPKVRVFRWQEIARITLSQFDGDLDQILKLSWAQAKKALKQFPNIGDPGAEKILVLRRVTRTSVGMERFACSDPCWLWTMAEKLRRCLQVSAGSVKAGASTQGGDDCPGPFVIAATWKRDLPRQIAAMLWVFGEGLVCVSSEAVEGV